MTTEAERVADAKQVRGLRGFVARFLASPTRLLRWSAVLTLIALVLMVWSMLDPTPLPVMVAMTAGQGLGTVAFGLFLFVIVLDLRRARHDRRDQDSLIPDTSPEPEATPAPVSPLTSESPP